MVGMAREQIVKRLLIKRVHKLHATTQKIAHISRRDDQLMLLRGGGYQHVDCGVELPELFAGPVAAA